MIDSAQTGKGTKVVVTFQAIPPASHVSGEAAAEAKTAASKR
jgi:hypothetical protein